MTSLRRPCRPKQLLDREMVNPILHCFPPLPHMHFHSPPGQKAPFVRWRRKATFRFPPMMSSSKGRHELPGTILRIMLRQSPNPREQDLQRIRKNGRLAKLLTPGKRLRSSLRLNEFRQRTGRQSRAQKAGGIRPRQPNYRSKNYRRMLSPPPMPCFQRRKVLMPVSRLALRYPRRDRLRSLNAATHGGFSVPLPALQLWRWQSGSRRWFFSSSSSALLIRRPRP